MSRRPSKSVCLLFLESDAWQLACADLVSEKATFPPDALGDQSKAMLEVLHEAGWRGAPLVVGLAPAMCLTATVPVPAPQLLRKPSAMRYHLEGWIPWSAEEFVSDFAPHTTEAFMTAVRIEPLRTLLAELEAQDIVVATLTPTALLALEHHVATGHASPDHVLLWRHGDETEFFVVKDGQPLQWRHAIEDVPSLAAVARLEQAVDVPWFARGLELPEVAALEAAGLRLARLPELSWDEAVREAALAVAAGEVEPFVNLRRDELAGVRPVRALSRQLAALKAAAALACLAVCAALWIRGDKLAEAADEARRSLAALYEKTFPQNPIPDRIAQVMRREHMLLQAARGAVAELPAGFSGDAVLDRAVAALPADLRFRVPEIRVEGDSVYLTGEVRTNTDADRIAADLRQAGFDVQPPRTQRLADQGFSVHWTARLAAGGGRK
jgi:hypothetical protein